MKTRKKLILSSIVLFAMMLFSFCQKKLFKHVEVKGTIVHLSSQQPLANGTVYLYSDDATSAKSSTQGSILLTSSKAGSDGSFTLKTRAAKGGIYYLYVEKDNGRVNPDPGGHQSFAIPDNSTKDLGVVTITW
jgi:hypothetical protein